MRGWRCPGFAGKLVSSIVLVGEGTQKKPLGLKNNQNFNHSTQVVDSISLYKVSIMDRLTTSSTIDYVGSISTSSSFESRPPIGRTCQRRHSNDQCSLLENIEFKCLNPKGEN